MSFMEEGGARMKYPWLEVAKKIQALTQSGLAYTKNEYDKERYELIRQISNEIVAEFSDTDMDKVEEFPDSVSL